MAAVKRAPGGPLGARACAAVPLALLVGLVLSDTRAALGWLRILSAVTTSNYPLSMPCDFDPASNLTLVPARELPASLLPRPLGEAWIDALSQPVVVRTGDGEQRAESFLRDFGHEVVRVRALDHLTQAFARPATVLTAGHIGDFNCSEKDVKLSDLLAPEGSPADGDEYLYGAFMSLNHTYAALDGLVDEKYFYRNDLFMGRLAVPTVTAPFHSNVLEKSATYQIVGHKLWLFLSPEEFHSCFQAFPVLAVKMAGSLAECRLRDVELSYAVTGPGDVVAFPRGYPHFVLTLEGPSLMVNHRVDDVRLAASFLQPGLSTLDRFSFFTALLAAKFTGSFMSGGRDNPRRPRQAVPPGVIVDYHLSAHRRTRARSPDSMEPFWRQLCSTVRAGLPRDEPAAAHRAAMLDGACSHVL